jgi:predicted aspartyl protease
LFTFLASEYRLVIQATPAANILLFGAGPAALAGLKAFSIGRRPIWNGKRPVTGHYVTSKRLLIQATPAYTETARAGNTFQRGQPVQICQYLDLSLYIERKGHFQCGLPINGKTMKSLIHQKEKSWNDGANTV